MGWRGLTILSGLQGAGSVRAASAIAGASLLCTGCTMLSGPPQQAALHAPAAQNTGRPPSGAFLADFSMGRPAENLVLSNWDMTEEWLTVAYRKTNIAFDGAQMTLGSQRSAHGEARYTSSEFQRGGFYGYGRYEALMQAASDTGVVTAFFTYTGKDVGDPHDEIDFELLGRSPRQAHTNFFNHGQGAPVDIDLWFDASAGEHLYVFEWTPDRITWSIDGVKVREVKASDPGVTIPSTTSRVMASIWAAQGEVEAWAGAPDFAATQAQVRCMSHVPLGQTGRQCSDAYGGGLR